MHRLNVKEMFVISGGAVAVLGGLFYGAYRSWELGESAKLLGQKVAVQEQMLTLTEEHLEEVKSDLAHAEQENRDLVEVLTAEQSKNRMFEAQIRDISGAVGTLQKLSRLDPELLRKYSKVYFLSENYAPAQLSPVSAQYAWDKNKPQLIHAAVSRFLESLLASAARDNVTLQVVSAFRSFSEQASVKYGYKVTYGAGTANQFSADQGYSEHQLGTTVDLTSPEIKGVLLSFEKTPAYKWLGENAYKFGFILSYPKGNSYYQFEPWHWRFVGVSLAVKLHNESRNFYELSQREINEYLISIFD